MVPYDLHSCADSIFEGIITTWDQYLHRIHNFHLITDANSNGVSLMCSCPIGLKNYTCKHSVGLAIRYFQKDIPLAAKTIPLGCKRAAGRPKKVGTAFERENS